jgi:signal transduction histidine kinase
MRRRSVFTELSLWLGLTPVIAFLLIGLIVILMSRQALRTELVNQINDDMAALVLTDAEDGPQALEDAITQRVSLNSVRAGAPYYQLAYAPGRIIGNLDEVVSDFTQPVAVNQDGLIILARGTPLRSGRVLVVGRDTRAVAATLRTLGLAIGIGALILALMSFLLTRWHIERLRRRTKLLNDTFDNIAQGHLNTRIALSPKEDELDELGVHINTMLDRLHRLLTLRKRLTDQLAHEIRSPLARLDASLAQARNDGQQSIEAARQDLSRTLVLLDGLLDISALEAQAGDRRNFADIAFGELVTEVFDLFEPLAETNDITMLLGVEAGIKVSGDRSQLGRLVSNLLDNAIKYATGSPINVVVAREGTQVILSVTNLGPTIGESLKSEIFTPFFRHPDAQIGKGHGLGLALCHSIALRHAGEISVDSEGGLTTFNFILPILD